MRIFITGATGYIGFAVASALAAKGHQVFGLARSEEKAKKLAGVEVNPVIGSMNDVSSYVGTARSCQILIHCAAEWSEQFHKLDRQTIETFLNLISPDDTKRTIIYTSGVWVYGNTHNEIADESSRLNPPSLVRSRVETESLLLNSNKNNISTIIMRPGCVYGGSGGLTAGWFKSAMENGTAEIVGDGYFRWSTVHVQDLAAAYVHAAESSFTQQIFNVTDRSRFTILECAKAANQAAGKNEKIKIIPQNEAEKIMGSMVECLTLNQHVDSSKISCLLGWQPKHVGFADGAVRYFLAWKALNT
jgi:nucleoside-diphosphate-sugar epimerase